MLSPAEVLRGKFYETFAEIERSRANAPSADDLLPIWLYSISADIGLRSIAQVRPGFLEQSEDRRKRAVAPLADIYADQADTYDRRDPDFLPVLSTALATSLVDLAVTTQSWAAKYRPDTPGLHFLAWDWEPSDGQGKRMSFRCLEEADPRHFDANFLFAATVQIAELELEKDPNKAPKFIRR